MGCSAQLGPREGNKQWRIEECSFMRYKPTNKPVTVVMGNHRVLEVVVIIRTLWISEIWCRESKTVLDSPKSGHRRVSWQSREQNISPT